VCGIAGLWLPSGNGKTLENRVLSMTRALAHRGPDGERIWVDEGSGLGLGHRRLAILDLTETGTQPMRSVSGRYVIVFNGEIYNFRALRAELELSGHGFRGHSDTETILAAVESWGVETALRRFVGMFAFALWDTQGRELTLARDRAGKKPLYFWLDHDRLYFGSELVSLQALEGLELEIDRQAVGQFLRYGYVPGPRSIYRNVSKLPAGTTARVRLDSSGRLACEAAVYWSVSETFREARASRRSVSFADASHELESLLEDAVRLRLESDVPLGAFLSGGIDSSVVVALMQRLGSQPVRTFTIGFHEGGYDEAKHAAEVSRYLGTDHTELYVEPREVLDLVPRMAQVFDEPFADSSQMPTLLVAQLARRHVTVALSGDGGDEVFGGYRRYQRFVRWWQIASRIPPAARPTIAAALDAASRLPLGPLWAAVGRLIPADLGSVTPAQQVAKIAGLLRQSGMDNAYERQLAHWDDPAALAFGSHAPWWSPPGQDPGDGASIERCFERMMELDFGHYLPDDILVKVDRTSMSVGLEARAPLLDHRILEFAAHLPVSHRVQVGEGKLLLKDVAYRLVPRELLERPKQGFGVPLAQWLRGPLRDWAESLLDERALEAAELVAPAPIRRLWQSHLAGHRDWSALLWDVLMLQSWHEQHVSNRANPRSPV
jgi:asparagine synthase (glutamine-hydrolysing)